MRRGNLPIMATRKSAPPPAPGSSELLLYTTPDQQTRIEVRLEDETVWLSQAQMTELFQTTKQNISLHIRNIYGEGELVRSGTVKESLTVQSEGSRQVQRQIELYNLDVIISVGYRVKSHRGTQFRIWATQRLREYLVKGFAIDDERLKDARPLPGGRDYFDELLERIRDIRTSEKRFYQKVCDIYRTAVDYDPAHDLTQTFFATVQNKHPEPPRRPVPVVRRAPSPAAPHHVDEGLGAKARRISEAERAGHPRRRRPRLSRTG